MRVIYLVSSNRTEKAEYTAALEHAIRDVQKLTEADKRTLMRSRFFYRPNDTPVFQPGKVIASYPYTGGVFEQHTGTNPIYWIERKTESDATFTFEEARRDTQYIYLYVSSRGFTVRLPIAGGLSSLSADQERTWQSLYSVTKEGVASGR